MTGLQEEFGLDESGEKDKSGVYVRSGTADRKNGYSDAPESGPGSVNPAYMNYPHIAGATDQLIGVVGAKLRRASSTPPRPMSGQDRDVLKAYRRPKLPQHPANMVDALINVANSPQAFRELFVQLDASASFQGYLRTILAPGRLVKMDSTGPTWTIDELILYNSAIPLNQPLQFTLKIKLKAKDVAPATIDLCKVFAHTPWLNRTTIF